MPRSGSRSAPPSATAMRPRSAARAASRRDGYPRLPALRRGVAWSVRSSVLSVDTGLNAGLRYGQPDELFHFIFSSGVSSAKCYDAPCRLSNECGRMGAIQTDVELKLLAKSILQLRRIGCSPGAPGATAKGRLTKSSDLRIFPHQFELTPGRVGARRITCYGCISAILFFQCTEAEIRL